jgi:cyclopropane-fatty-acyl-phospholipid synthase
MSNVLENFFTRFIRYGDLEVETASGRKFKAGDGTGPSVGLRFADARSEWRLLRDPEFVFGELYMDGLLTVTRGGIYDALMIAARNIEIPSSRWMASLRRARMLLRRWRQRNAGDRAKRNVAHHYDIDRRLYALFLDTDQQYSCAYFEHPDDSLEDAQLAKKRHIAAKLVIEPGQSVLDIGCGWGGLDLYLAKYCSANVTGVTLSKEQLAIAQVRAQERGLSSKVEFRLQDYREVRETFDRIVSVGMFEHVGVGYFGAFFRKLAAALNSDGVALLHTIGNPGVPIPTNPWVEKYIFPGGYVPSMSEIMPAIEGAGLKVTDIEILRLHYAETLKAWRDRFTARRDEATALYDERFCRMWEFYLALAEAMFRAGLNVVFQIQLTKKVDSVPMTRDYIADRERQLRARDSGRANLRIADKYSTR